MYIHIICTMYIHVHVEERERERGREGGRKGRREREKEGREGGREREYPAVSGWQIGCVWRDSCSSRVPHSEPRHAGCGPTAGRDEPRGTELRIERERRRDEPRGTELRIERERRREGGKEGRKRERRVLSRYMYMYMYMYVQVPSCSSLNLRQTDRKKRERETGGVTYVLEYLLTDESLLHVFKAFSKWMSELL